MKKIIVVALVLLIYGCGNKTEKQEKTVIERDYKKEYYEELKKEDPFYVNASRWVKDVGSKILNIKDSELYKIYERKVLINEELTKRDNDVKNHYLLKSEKSFYILVFNGVENFPTDILKIENAFTVMSKNKMEKLYFKDNLLQGTELIGSVKSDFYVENHLQYFKYKTFVNETEIVTILDLGNQKKF